MARNGYPVEFRRRALDLTEALLADPERVDEIIRSAIGCVVTKDEHDRLGSVSASASGWGEVSRCACRCVRRADWGCIHQGRQVRLKRRRLLVFSVIATDALADRPLPASEVAERLAAG
jgi:hypothetical protein